MTTDSPVTNTGGAGAFQVDLHGVVDLLARHLYSSPRVYLRELLQNGVDAITARRELPGQEHCPAEVGLRPLPDGGLEIIDTGIGVTAAEAQTFLATIGHSSKRDLELGGGRDEFLGQFGIGLLSAFMVADSIDMVSRSARTGAPSDLVHWRGYADGRYELTTLPTEHELGAALDGAAGSVVRLWPRRDMEHWLALDTVTALAEDFGSLLPVDLWVDARLDDDTQLHRRLSADTLPWQRQYRSPAERAGALRTYCERVLGFTPLAHIDLDLPIAGLTGVAFVLPTALSPTTTTRHRVYVKRMLLGQVPDLLPPWAFFVRCIVDTGALRPTASREGLYEDEVFLATKEALGAQIRAWTLKTLADDTEVAGAFLKAHHLAVRAGSLTDDEMLDVALRVLPFETTHGVVSVHELHEQYPDRLLFTPTVEEFRRIAPVAAAQDLPVINGGYVYDGDLLGRVTARYPSWNLAPVRAEDVSGVLCDIEPLRELEIIDTVAAMSRVLAEHDCDAIVRRFEPAALPVMLLHDREGEHARRAQATIEAGDDLWGSVLSGFATEPAPTRHLVLNDANDMVQAVLAATDPPIRTAATQSLYLLALLASGAPLGSQEARTMNSSLTTLVQSSLRGPGNDDTPPPAPPRTGDIAPG